MSLNMKTLTQALAKTAAVIEKTVQTTVQEVTGPKPLQDYDLLDQIGSAGPGLSWKLYSAKARGGGSGSSHLQYPTVCVWVLDKRSLSEMRARAGLSKAAEESFLEMIRCDASRLVRLRHPGVVHVVQALDESKNAMAMVTEPLFASVANALGNVVNIAKVSTELKGMEMGLLEVKHGLLQVAESLDFLHNNARLVHRAISPENVLITAHGAWKLAGFSFAVYIDQSSTELSNVQAFHYAEYDVEDSPLPLQPSLNYTAPELVRSKAPSVGWSSDIFSYGCLAYELIARQPLFDCHNNVRMYTNSLTYLSSEAFSLIPPELVPDLQRMLSSNENLRPTASDFTGSPFFRDDTRLRALRFLDHMLERDNMQKTEFLKALADMWKDFDARVLRYKVLPPLCSELRNLVMQPMILPMVLTIAESQDKNDFELSTLPALVPVLSSAAGETLLLLVKNAELIINKVSQDKLVSHVLPMLVRAYDDTDARMQEEVLKKTVYLAKQLNIQLVKQAILPRVHGLALKTTIAAVRVNALLCLGDMVPELDKPAIIDILQTIQRCTAVDHSAPTLMCTLSVSNSILKQHGVEFAAEHILPLLTPLLIAQQLNVQQFAKYILFVKDILRKIEEKRGVSVSESGFPEMKKSSSTPDVHQSEQVKKNVSSARFSSKSSASWDEDWIPVRRSAADLGSSSVINLPSTPHSIPNQSVPLPSSGSLHSPTFIVPCRQQGSMSSSSCPAAGQEWRPQSPFDAIAPRQQTVEEHQVKEGLVSVLVSEFPFDDIDPFGTWPPRPSGSALSAAGGALNNGAVASALSKQVMTSSNTNAHDGLSFQPNISGSNVSWEAFSSQTINSTSATKRGGLDSHSEIGGGSLMSNLGALSMAVSTNRTADLGSIFGSGKTEHSAPILPPPPSTAVVRGRGRGRVKSNHVGITPPSSQSAGPKSSSEQLPLLDLL